MIKNRLVLLCGPCAGVEGLSDHFTEEQKGPLDPRSEGANTIKGAGMPLAPWKLTCKDVRTAVSLPWRAAQEGWNNGDWGLMFD